MLAIFKKNQSSHIVENGPWEETWEQEGRFGQSVAVGQELLLAWIHSMGSVQEEQTDRRMPGEEVKKKQSPRSWAVLRGTFLVSLSRLPRSGRATCPDSLQSARGPLTRPETDTQAMSTLMALVFLLALGLSCKPSDNPPHLVYLPPPQVFPMRKWCRESSTSRSWTTTVSAAMTPLGRCPSLSTRWT